MYCILNESRVAKSKKCITPELDIINNPRISIEGSPKIKCIKGTQKCMWRQNRPNTLLVFVSVVYNNNFTIFLGKLCNEVNN